jgi:hypothetical protein
MKAIVSPGATLSRSLYPTNRMVVFSFAPSVMPIGYLDELGPSGDAGLAPTADL